MSALPGLIGLLIFIYMRPQEFIPGLKDANFLHLFLGICVLGMLHDIARGRAHLMKTPALGWMMAFMGWCALTLAHRRLDVVADRVTGLLVSAALYVVIAHGIQTSSSFFKVAVTIFALGLFVACVGVDQGMRPFQCMVAVPGDQSGASVADGRECSYVNPDGTPNDAVYDCIYSGQPALVYTCERAGLFGTTSIGGRVRYLGVLMDPNELALATAVAVPFAFALLRIRRTALRLSLLLVTLLIVAVEIVFTQSRGGQLTFLAVIGVYFVRAYGWRRGALVGATLAVPILLLGGRSNESADESTLERLEAAAAGIKMLRTYPVHGAGYSMFTENHNLTAHNAYILAAGELGGVGMCLFAFILYLSVKIPFTVVCLGLPDDSEGRLVKALAMAMLAAMAGMTVGIFFLSWTYHYILWIHFGLSGALYTIVKRRHPTYVCALSRREMLTIAAGYVAFLVVWSVYVKFKGAWN